MAAKTGFVNDAAVITESGVRGKAFSLSVTPLVRRSELRYPRPSHGPALSAAQPRVDLRRRDSAGIQPGDRELLREQTEGADYDRQSRRENL